KAQLAFHRFHLRGKQGAKIDIGLALMALNLRKLGKYMERKIRKKERTRSILMIIAKIERVFFLRTDYCPRLFLFYIQTMSENYWGNGFFKNFSEGLNLPNKKASSFWHIHFSINNGWKNRTYSHPHTSDLLVITISIWLFISIRVLHATLLVPLDKLASIQGLRI
ncbi:hypothetical protein LI951_04540, partial [Enterococcus sp. BWT-B8]|nr:hypothetical protein [Enterococcus sp. BWT-B8]